MVAIGSKQKKNCFKNNAHNSSKRIKEGLNGITVYALADFGFPQGRFVDRTIFIGDSHIQESYLQITKILDAAYWVGPGVGLMSQSISLAVIVQEFKNDFSNAYDRLFELVEGN